MTLTSVIRSTGSFLPARILTNKELETIVDTTDEWIVQRTGIEERHIAAKDEPTSFLAINAAKNALESSGLRPEDIDGVIVATTTPDQSFPSVAVKVQAALDLKPGPAFDVQAVCSGFIYALSVADSMIRSGSMNRVMVVGAEKMSSLLDWTDRSTCVLFGDGAGAVILEKSEQEAQGILSTHLYANGRLNDLLYTDGGVSTSGTAGHIIMHGKEVFKNAVTLMADIVEEVLTKNNVSPENIDWLIPHQANLRIITGTAEKLGMSMDRVVVTVNKHGNTSAASIPLALDDAVRSGKVQRGQLLLLEALGGGLTWGAALIRF
ncbi:MAG: ketoacyl-ACP synthase III [Alphaproteobacteria bacterium]|jgi:3-oxoacyl-[acyl-carrier-protein] synthase-3|nr:ketoacyl-ACP synthase III [Alphaproteobacteria bacterium]MCB1552039.1 ketoacyl-ACP synthase III [Alphaproteobacteria bacterium]MCB9984614.1 ketoacyl-ACP synthase III [Micavibrio sp.]HPQ51234.1 beta-ketoacyl-ACP synthase III [Alphaproteobacteria bacterium]HRK97957.1 beta-ketoacyl-ACP synthase III [Alphaproteobacteria bacterium]